MRGDKSVTTSNMQERDEIIRFCHHFGLKQREIVDVLSSQFGLEISMRQLRRILHRLGLQRRGESDIVDVASFVSDSLNTSAQQHGYRLMHLRCTLNGYKISMHNVRKLLKLLDPEGVELRRRRRLIRRRYYSKGPNFTWHLDSYDKLKPYGIAINGCIDGYSRYILWLEANFTASDPKVVGGYFMKTVEMLNGFPEFIRGDRGTENVVVEQLQTVLHETINDRNATDHFKYGRSTANQRIESWWSFLRKQCTEFWIAFFHQFRQDGIFNGDQLEQELVRFVFMDIIQGELDDIKTLWNMHQIRKTTNDQITHGRPVLMFTTPEQYGTTDYLQPIDNRYIDLCKEECRFKSDVSCDRDVHDLCELIMLENAWQRATDSYSGRDLYQKLRDSLRLVL